MRARISGFVTSLVLGAALTALAACGGGGGGGSTTPTIPGTLGAVALEGASAPGTGGVFGAFGATTLIDVADGGWTAFVAPVVGGTTSKGLFVRRPDGTVVDVFLQGQAAPAPNGGGATINDFGRIWMRPGSTSGGTAGGIVVAFVQLSGTAVEGLVSARIPTSAAVTERSGVISRGVALPVGARGQVVGALSFLDPDLVQVDDFGDIFFVGVGTGGATPLHGVWTINRLGALPAIRVAVTNDFAPVTGTLGFDFDGLGIDLDGQVVAYAVDVQSGPTHAIIATDGSTSGVIVSQDSAGPPNVGPRVFENVYAGGPLYVRNIGGVAIVFWQGDLTGAAPDIGVFTRSVKAGGVMTLGSLASVAVPSQAVSGLGAGATMSNIQMISGSTDPNRIPLLVDIAGGTSSRAIFSASSISSIAGVYHDGQAVPGTPATTFSTALPSLTIPGAGRADRVGSLAFSAVLANAQSGVYWEILSGGVFLLFQAARQGDVAPGTSGGTFGPFAVASPVLTASTFVVFTATVAGGSAPSGLFIQG